MCNLLEAFGEALLSRPFLTLEIGYTRATDWMVQIYDRADGLKKEVVVTQSGSRDEAMREAERVLKEHDESLDDQICKLARFIAFNFDDEATLNSECAVDAAIRLIGCLQLEAADAKTGYKRAAAKLDLQEKELADLRMAMGEPAWAITRSVMGYDK